MPEARTKNYKSDLPETETRLKEILSDQTAVVFAVVDVRLEKLAKRCPEKFNQLTTTLDKFLKSLTDFEEEEESKFLNEESRARKAVIREKLGVSLD